ncbi:hypothetical protein ABTM80_18855, partial [Acinetobacter baumannii]
EIRTVIPTLPKEMKDPSLSDVVVAQRGVLDHDLMPFVGGAAALEQITGRENAAAFLDALYRDGSSRGYFLINDAIDALQAKYPQMATQLALV